ncbi:major capsid protein [Streptomyces sp. NPDC002122]|uniref:major capsid protein n=1 Tax=Streptomyces sp. NPDC002122 TaxID=3154407 RepID=UPI00331C0202
MADQTPDETVEPQPPVTFNIAEATDEALIAEYGRVKAAGQELSAQADANPAELSGLATQLQELSAAVAERKTQAEATQAARDVFSAAPELTIPTQVIPEAKAEVYIGDQKVTEVMENPVVPSVSQMAAQPRPTPHTPKVTRDLVRAELSATAAGLLGMKTGDTFTGDNNVGIALIKNAQSFGMKGAPGQSQVIAQYKREREFVVDTSDERETRRILKAARNERRLDGGNLATAYQRSVEQSGSLTAAAGWCAPSQNDYDLCRNWGEGVGLLDLPTVTVTRGGINYTQDPNFPEIYANAVAAGGGSNFLTEAQVIADTAKTCSEIPCPDFTNRRLDVMALCIRVSFLQAAGYPEVVEAWEDGLREAHQQEMNRIILADLIATAGATTTWLGGVTAPDSFTTALLSAARGARMDMIYRWNLPANATVEMALPLWVTEQIRADLSRRTRENMPLLQVSDAQIAQLFTSTGIRPQFVRGWQDGLITGGALNPAFPGGDATAPYMTALPDDVSFLVWPAGSVAVARQDVVTLTNVYDAASLAQNEFTALFAEEGFAPIYPCPGIRQYTVGGCLGGLVGAASITCAP